MLQYSIGDDVTTPITLKMGPNLFFRIAEIKYLLFEPKNNALDAFLKNLEARKKNHMSIS